MELKRKKVSSGVEEDIVTGLIISDGFCREVAEIYKKGYLKNPQMDRVAYWCIDYFKKYRKAPKELIKDIFTVEKKNLSKEEIDIIKLILIKLSDKYGYGDKYNVDYTLQEKAIPYFKQVVMESAMENAEALIKLGKIEDAERELTRIVSIRRDTSSWENPLDPKVVKAYFKDLEEKRNYLLRLPGKLGEIVGDLERGTLLGILGSPKRGKSFWIQEIAVRALFERLKVIWISLEMGNNKSRRRIYKRLTAWGDENKSYVFPAFDCRLNQMNMCSLPERKNNKPLMVGGERPVEYDPAIRYKICTACRNKKNSDYKPATWYIKAKRKALEVQPAVKFIGNINEVFQQNFRFRAYPKFSANISNILSDIDQLEQEEGFIPDVVCIDYADILAPEDSRETGRDRIDSTWKMLGNLGDVKHCLVVTASQTNRQAIDKSYLRQTDVAEDIRKIANVDIMLALNQLPSEKRRGVLRVSVIAGREGDFDEFKTITVLEQREVGQVLLDSEMIVDEKKVEENRKAKESEEVDKFSDSSKLRYNRDRKIRSERKEGCT